MLSMSLRFVPTLMDDTIRIMNAFERRVVLILRRNVIQKVKAMIPILIPLFATSLKRAILLLQPWKLGVSRWEWTQSVSTVEMDEQR